MRPCSLLVAGLLACLATPALGQDPKVVMAEDVSKNECEDGSHGFVVADPLKKGIEGATVDVERSVMAKSGKGCVAFAYKRRPGQVPVLYHVGTSVTGLTRLGFWIRSDSATAAVVVLNDLDGASFNTIVQLPPGRWVRIDLTPARFKPNRDGKVRKERLDPARLGQGFGIFDALCVKGVAGANTLRVDSVEVHRGTIALSRGPWVIDGRTAKVTANRRHEGTIAVRNGGTLHVTGCRFVHHDRFVLEEGTFRLTKVTFHVAQRFRSEFKVQAGGKSNLVWDDVHVLSPHPVDLMARGDTAFTLTEVRMGLAGFHVEVGKGCRLVMDRVIGAGEFLLPPGASIEARRCRGTLFWFMFAIRTKGAVQLPQGDRVEDWTFDNPFGMKLSVKDCRDVWWGTVVPTGCDLTISKTRFRAIGFLFVADAKVAGLRNKTRYAQKDVSTGAIAIHLRDAEVDAWNFYVAGKARVEVRDCLFGEALTFHKAHLDIHTSTCDGTGGFLGAMNESTIALTNCKVDCDINVYDDARVDLDRSAVRGDVTVTGRSRVGLLQTRIWGSRRSFDKGSFVEKD